MIFPMAMGRWHAELNFLDPACERSAFGEYFSTLNRRVYTLIRFLDPDIMMFAYGHTFAAYVTALWPSYTHPKNDY